jgi:hypothetical protein
MIRSKVKRSGFRPDQLNIYLAPSSLSHGGVSKTDADYSVCNMESTNRYACRCRNKPRETFGSGELTPNHGA